MTEELKKLAEDAFTACYEKGLGDKSEDREAWTLREAVARLAKKELLDALERRDREMITLRTQLDKAESLLEAYHEDCEYRDD